MFLYLAVVDIFSLWENFLLYKFLAIYLSILLLMSIQIAERLCDSGKFYNELNCTCLLAIHIYIYLSVENIPRSGILV